MNDGLKGRLGNRLAFGLGSLEPGGFGLEHFRESLFGVPAESGAVRKVGMSAM